MIELPSLNHRTTTNATSTGRRGRLRKRLFLFHLFLILFVSEVIEDVECNNSKLRGSSYSSSPEHVHHDHLDIDVSNPVAMAHDSTEEKEKTKKKILEHDMDDDHHPHDEEDTSKNNRAGAQHQHNNDNNNNKASYDSGMPSGEYWDETGPKDSTRPLLELVMLVKNEAKSIVETINSVKDHVDRWTILDTGSTDGTQDLIRKTFRGVPGNLHQGEFVDFSTSRNRALQLAGFRSIFTLMLSGDESIRDGAAMREFLEKHKDWSWTTKKRKKGMKRRPQHEAYNMRIIFGSMVYDSTRIARTDAHWFYTGATHEYMTNPKRRVATIRVEGNDGKIIPAVFHDLSNNEKDHKMKRWRLDLELLQNDWKLHPNKTRTAFYTAQSYECLGELENAFKWYVPVYNSSIPHTHTHTHTTGTRYDTHSEDGKKKHMKHCIVWDVLH